MIGAIGGGGLNAAAGNIGIVNGLAPTAITDGVSNGAGAPTPSSIVRISLAGQQALARDDSGLPGATLAVDIQMSLLAENGPASYSAGRMDQLVMALLLALLLQDRQDQNA